MRYVEFRDQILGALHERPQGLTWNELKELLDLAYKQPCYEWLYRMEAEDGLRRAPGPGRAYRWTVVEPQPKEAHD